MAALAHAPPVFAPASLIVLVGLYSLGTKIKIAHQMSCFKATRTKINIFRGSTQDPAGGPYSTPPDALAGFKGSYF